MAVGSAKGDAMRVDFLLCCGLLLWASCARGSGTVASTPGIFDAVVKTNPTKVYAHYLPWFADEESSGNGDWGLHWTMANRDPDVVDEDGRRQIAAHYYPLIGPYSSSDPDLIEYHLLLMKLSGIDGVLIDWYGAHDVFDYRPNKRNAEALIDRFDEVGLEFGIVYEEFTAAHVAEAEGMGSAIEAAQVDLRYMQSEYFAHDRYIHRVFPISKSVGV